MGFHVCDLPCCPGEESVFGNGLSVLNHVVFHVQGGQK